jgi:hypothetical protein
MAEKDRSKSYDGPLVFIRPGHGFEEKGLLPKW